MLDFPTVLLETGWLAANPGAAGAEARFGPFLSGNWLEKQVWLDIQGRGGRQRLQRLHTQQVRQWGRAPSRAQQRHPPTSSPSWMHSLDQSDGAVVEVPAEAAIGTSGDFSSRSSGSELGI